jgi:CubicO group peptidase (beta-lactamase class C family)
MSPLSQIATWDVPNAAAAIFGPSGATDGYGDINRPFALASITKLFTGYATLLAIEEGVIHLHSPAGPPGATVHHLLAHASGYGFQSNSRTLATPGQRRIYSNQGMEVLAEAVGAAVGMPFVDYVRQGVLEPLGMTQSSFRGSAAFGMSSTVADLGRFVAEVMDPRLLAPTTVADALTVHFPGLNGVLPGFGPQRPMDWGLGFEIKGTKHPHWSGTLTSGQTFGHFGGAGTFMWVDPTRSLACVCLTDRRFGPWAPPLWSALSDSIVKGATQII